MQNLGGTEEIVGDGEKSTYSTYYIISKIHQRIGRHGFIRNAVDLQEALLYPAYVIPVL